MEWLEQFQRDLGTPVLGFLVQNWIFVLIIGGLGVAWLIMGEDMFRVRGDAGVTLDGIPDGDGDSGGSDGGGGGDGGGGD
jgi:hypothetical protein